MLPGLQPVSGWHGVKVIKLERYDRPPRPPQLERLTLDFRTLDPTNLATTLDIKRPGCAAEAVLVGSCRFPS